jgi:hypothetical protein
MHKLSRVPAWVIAGVCACTPAFAWGPEGHDLVARIAEAQLTPAARAKVAEILGPGVSMASVSSWADQVRRERAPSGPWHYVDIPIDKAHFDRQRDCPKDDCVVAQIELDEKALRDPATPPAVRREALMFLIHFIGDLHQPLHSSDNKDKGGNDVHVTFFDRPGNLHGTWDSGLLARMGKEDDLFPVLLKDAEKHSRKWSKGTPEKWAEQAHKESVRTVYGKLPKPPAGGNALLGADYERSADPLIREQIEKAGDRLARTLNRIFQ